jgi:hypothetical protein
MWRQQAELHEGSSVLLPPPSKRKGSILQPVMTLNYVVGFERIKPARVIRHPMVGMFKGIKQRIPEFCTKRTVGGNPAALKKIILRVI